MFFSRFDAVFSPFIKPYMANLRYLFKNIVVSFNHQGLQLIVVILYL